MRRVCLAALMCWWLPTAAFATPCIPGSLASYLALGGAGCTVGNALFSNFVNLPLQGGALAIPDSATLVNPLDPAHPGLRFDVNAAATSGALRERVIGYTLSGPGFLNSQLMLGTSNVVVDGAVTVSEKECLGAAFGPGQFCSATDAQQVAFDLGALGQSTNVSMAMSLTTLLGVITDITVDAGTAGSARLASATTQFTPAATPVPEPATLMLVAIGLAASIGRLRHRQRPQR